MLRPTKIVAVAISVFGLTVVCLPALFFARAEIPPVKCAMASIGSEPILGWCASIRTVSQENTPTPHKPCLLKLAAKYRRLPDSPKRSNRFTKTHKAHAGSGWKTASIN